MSHLIPLRRHIKSIQTTKKITYAMRLIAMSLYSKLDKQSADLSHYHATILSLFNHLLALEPKWTHPFLMPVDILNSTPLYIVISSSKGLCGGFNTHLIKYFKQSFFKESHQTPAFITIGSYAQKFIEEEKVGPIISSFPSFSASNFLTIVNSIMELLKNNPENYSSLTIFSNQFHNFFTQKPCKTILIPCTHENLKKIMQEHLHKQKGAVKKEKQRIEFEQTIPIWEQAPATILDYLAFMYIRTSLIHLLFQSLLSEQAMRFIAMDHATTNADQFIEKLTLKYNKTRQGLITKELSELSAGFATFK